MIRLLTTSATNLANALERIPLRSWTTLLLALLTLPRLGLVIATANLTDPYLYETGIIARNILSGDGYAVNYRFPVPSTDLDAMDVMEGRPQPTAFTLPGYVAIVTPVLALFGESRTSWMFLYAINILTTIAAGWFVYLITRRVAGERAARIAALLFAVYPPAIALATTFGGGPIYQCVLTAAILLFLRAADTGRWGDVAVAGLLGGVWILFRAEALVLTALGALWILRRISWRKAVVFYAIVVAVVAPWSVRNTLTFGHLVPLTTNGWLNIWRGFNEETTGGSFHRDGTPNWFDTHGDIVREMKALPVTRSWEIDAMEVYKRRALAYITADPLRAVGWYLRKAGMFLTLDTSDRRVLQPLFFVPHLALSLATLAGLIALVWRRRRRILPILVVIMFYWLLIPLFHVESRYQLMLSVLYVIPAVAAWVRAPYDGWYGLFGSGGAR